MDKQDMASLIEVEDTLADMDKVLHLLAGHGYANGEFTKLDNVFDVIYRNSHEVYLGNPEEGQELFFEIIMNREMTPDERAEILWNGLV